MQQLVARIPWGQNIALMDKVNEQEQRLWYAEKCLQNGWSRNVLIHQIESRLFDRQKTATKIANFPERLPSPQSEMAMQTMKDPYVFDFISFREDMLEKDIEQALVRDGRDGSIRPFLTVSFHIFQIWKPFPAFGGKKKPSFEGRAFG